VLASIAFGNNASLAFDHSALGMTDTYNVAANSVGFGGALYLKSDGSLYNSDADARSTMPCLALALSAGTGGKTVLLIGLIRDDSWNWTPGGLVYASGTTGQLTQTIPTGTGKLVQIVGIAKAINVLFFNPSYLMVERVS